MADPEYIGIEIGGTKLQLVRGNMQISAAIRRDIDTKGAAAIQRQITECLEELMAGKNIAGIGVGFGGPVDHVQGVIRVSHQVAGWNDFPMKEWLEGLTGKTAVIDNDANVAALGEAMLGAGTGFNNVFYMTIGSGIGGGMVMNGAVYHGRAPGEVEIGHLRLDRTGTTLESACSGWAVNRQVRNFAEKNPGSALARLASAYPGHEAKCLAAALQEGDAAANNIMNAVVDDLALGLSHMVHLFNPDIIVIGGGLSLLHDYLLQPLRIRLPEYLMKAMLPEPALRVAVLGEAVVPTGALALARSLITNELYLIPRNQTHE